MNCLLFKRTINDDQLPEIVCSQCLDTLKALYPFILKSTRTHEEQTDQLQFVKESEEVHVEVLVN